MNKEESRYAVIGTQRADNPVGWDFIEHGRKNTLEEAKELAKEKEAVVIDTKTVDIHFWDNRNGKWNKANHNEYECERYCDFLGIREPDDWSYIDNIDFDHYNA